MERMTLLRVLKRVQGASTPTAQVAAFRSVFFDAEFATTYDGELAAWTPCQLQLDGGVELRPLAVWVNSCSGPVISVKVVGAAAQFSCGRSRLKLPLLEPSQLAFERPSESEVWINALDVFEPALRRVSAFMGNDAAHPGLMGVTVAGDDWLRLYATDNVTMTTEHMSTGGLERPLQVVLPPRFVKLVLGTAKDDPVTSIGFGDGWATASFQGGDEHDGEDTIVFTRTGAEVTVDAYDSVINQSLWVVDQIAATEVTQELQTALKSVAIVMDSMGQVDCQLRVQDGELVIEAAGSDRGSARQSVPLDHEDGSIWLPAKELVRSIEDATRFTFVDGVLIAWGDGFVNLIAAASE